MVWGGGVGCGVVWDSMGGEGWCGVVWCGMECAVVEFSCGTNDV